MLHQKILVFFWQKALNILEHAEPNIPIMGLFGLVGFPLFYFIWSYIFPQEFENLHFRILIAIVSIPWVFYHHLPCWFKSFYPIYFILSCWLMIPFFFSFMLLKNEWSLVWTMSNMAALFLLILLINDWLVVSLLTTSAYLLASFLVFLLDGNIGYTNFQYEYIPIFLFGIVGSIIFSHKKNIANQTRILLLHSLSGSIAHEMRNPLNSIINAIESLQSIIPDKPGKQEKDKHQQYKLSRSGLISLHNVIEESSEIVIKANKIIDSILAGMQGKSLSTDSFKRITAKSCIHSTINSFSYNTLDEHKLVKDLSKKDFIFFGDKDLLVYVLFNLIKNALHYKKKPGFTIEISTETSSNGNTIKVRDTGPGIPASKKEKIFDEFYTSGKKNGIGLGLSFCRRVLTSFRGHITCNSKENEWTEFILHFPPYHSKEAEDLKKEVLQNKNILIVDNNSNNHRITDKYLSEWHCNTRHAQNGTQALSMLLRQHFDLILVNLEMPFLPGDEVARQIRRKKHNTQFPTANYKEIPIIGLSNHSEYQTKQKLLGSEMNELIPRPPRRKHIDFLFEKYFFSETEPFIRNLDIFLDNVDILIVDDNLTSRKFMGVILERMGACVMHAENGEEAIEHLEKNDYELIFMDMEMPVLNGVNTTKIIREGKRFKRFDKYREIPIIALTGNTDDANIALAKQSGMNDHLGKPFEKEDLARVLTTWLQPQ